MLDVVIALIISPDGSKALLGKKSHSGLLGGKWVLPGGKVEPGESLEQALHREVLEETGLTVLHNSPVLLSRECRVRDKVCTNHFFLILEVSGTLKPSSDLEELVWEDHPLRLLRKLPRWTGNFDCASIYFSK